MSSVDSFKTYNKKFGLYEGEMVPLDQPMIELFEAKYDGREV